MTRSLFGLLLLGTFVAAEGDQAPVRRDLLQAHIEYLGSDALEGRGTGTPGGDLAASYIARYLEDLELLPGGDKGSFLQDIPMHGGVPLASSRLILHRDERQTLLALGADYLLYNSGAQTFVPRPVPLVFAGYGVVAPEFEYNDYQSIDVQGKVVVFLSGEPYSEDPAYFAGRHPTVYSAPEAKHRLALARGARGTVMIQSFADPEARSWQEWQHLFAFEDVRLMYSTSSSFDVVMRGSRAAELFEGASFTLDEIFKMEKRHAITSFPLETSITFGGHFRQRDFIAHNVMATLPGADPQLRDTHLLVTAHYDHLGIGPPQDGDSIYNGVFDNAAGVAATLEIARVLSQSPRPRRSVSFLFVTGEEKGLLGSTYYVDHPVVSLYQTVANVNVDGIAMFDEFTEVIGIGADLSSLGDVLQVVAARQGLTVSTLPALFAHSDTYTESDQIAFARAGIPAILVMEGLAYRNTSRQRGLQRLIDWGQQIYHTPKDDLYQEINYGAAEQHTRLLAALSLELANAEEPPVWRQGVSFLNQRLQSIAEKR